MSEDRFHRVAALFRAALDVAEDERESYLRSEAAGDDGIVREVKRLLAAAARPDEFIDDAPGARIAGRHEPPRGLEGRVVNRYRIVRLLASGSMGTVYVAQQEQPLREVAFKVLHSVDPDEELRRRFEQEAEILGALNHPGIAQIFEAGTFQTDAGAELPFIVLELVDGHALVRYAEVRGLDRTERVELLRRVCDAVDHAHRCGVVHRDLKPGNVLVGPDGQPKVLDFGVARVSGSDLGRAVQATSAGVLLGTIGYMSPEQARGDPSLVDHRADVHALGAMLFELLTGQVPYEVGGLPLHEAVRVLDEDPPLRLASLDPSLRGDLDTVTRKALEKDPARRYGSAAELSADLGRYLAQEPIVARRPTATYRARRFVQRNPLFMGAVSAIVATLIVAVTLQARAASRAQAESRRASRALEFLVEVVASGDAKSRFWPAGDGRYLASPGSPLADRVLDALEAWDFEPAAEASLLLAVGQILDGEKRYDEAIRALRRAVAVLGEEEEPRAQDLVRAGVLLGNSLVLRASWENSSDGFEEGLARVEEAARLAGEHLEPDEPEALMAEFLSAGATGPMSPGGEEGLEAMVEFRQRALSARPEFHTLHRSLAREHVKRLLQLGRHDEALELGRTILDRARRTGTDLDIDVLRIACQVARVYRQRGDFASALRYDRRALEGFDRLFPRMGITEASVGLALSRDLEGLGRLEEARHVVQRLVEVLLEREGRVHFRLARASRRQAAILGLLGDQEGAGAALERCADYLVARHRRTWLDPTSRFFEESLADFRAYGRTDLLEAVLAADR